MSVFLIIFLFVLLYICYEKFVKPALYWQQRGIFHVKPWWRFVRVFLGPKSFAEYIKDAYDEFPDRRYFGSYQFLQPSLFVRDLELIKQITVKDFEYFTDHMGLSNEKSDPVMGLNLFSLKGEKWKDLRATLSPAFTSSKMKAMFTLISETAENFVQHFLENADGVELEMKDVYSKFTNDVIASCAFGIKCDSLKDETNEFFTMGKRITKFRGWSVVRAMMNALFPKLFEFFRIPLFPATVTNFFRRIVKDTISMREQYAIVRPDMIHLLMEARKGRLGHDQVQNLHTEGFATVDESNIGKTATKKIELTDDVITAQALIFFFAGFETSSTLMSFLSHELAVNPDIQKRLQAEVDETLKAGSTGKASYEDVSKMKFLDQVVSETLRKYPPGFMLNRACVKDYVIPAKNPGEATITLEKNCLVAIPVYAIHRNPEYFPSPDVFDPDRFSDENKSKIVPGSYMPFGSGPRNCIGSRFALLECKALTVCLLAKFDIVPIKRTAIPLRLSKAVSIGVKDGFWLGLKVRQDK